MKKQRYYLAAAAVILCWTMLQSIVEIRAEAANKGFISAGNISANNGAVVFNSTDINYLGQEADLLYNEIDYAALDLTEAAGTVTVSGSRQNLLDSHGIIDYDADKVIFSANDLLGLANQIDALEDYYASTVYKALNTIGTYLDKDGVIHHEPRTADSLILAGCEHLANGILQSQTVAHPESLPVTSDNITAGAAAWVNGQCIIGNGADNNRAYQQGLEDGENENNGEVDIRYTYHVHMGDSDTDPIPDEHVYYSTGNPGGCYKSSGHTHNKTGSCPKTHHTTCGKTGSTKPDDPNPWICPIHGYTSYTWGNDAGGGYTVWGCYYPTEWDEYKCSSAVNTWKIGCGKIAGRTVESAEVIIHRNKITRE